VLENLFTKEYQDNSSILLERINKMAFNFGTSVRASSTALKYGVAATASAVTIAATAGVLVCWDDISGAADNTEVIANQQSNDEEEDSEEVSVQQDHAEFALWAPLLLVLGPPLLIAAAGGFGDFRENLEFNGLREWASHALANGQDNSVLESEDVPIDDELAESQEDTDPTRAMFKDADPHASDYALDEAVSAWDSLSSTELHYFSQESRSQDFLDFIEVIVADQDLASYFEGMNHYGLLEGAVKTMEMMESYLTVGANDVTYYGRAMSLEDFQGEILHAVKNSSDNHEWRFSQGRVGDITDTVNTSFY
jgi:hypothetical protein